MNHITNPAFSDREKQYMEFILQHDFPEKSFIAEQLNKMRADELSREITPFFWMLQFRPGGVNPGQGPMRPCIHLEVFHGSGIAPTEFTLYERNGIVFEIEIYNADGSKMDLDTIMLGDTVVHPGN
jgi:hypothetical protein